MNKQGYLLLVEDDRKVQANNKKLLERRGYNLKHAFSLGEARAIISDETPQAIILDLQLPDGNGINFLHELRKTSNVPVLILTAIGTNKDILKGLKAGGDDYLSKPYDLEVFLTRVEALLRRSAIIPNTLRIGPLRLEIASGKAYLNDEDMVLTQKEFALFQQFVQYPGKALSVEFLYEKVWGQNIVEEDSSVKNAVYRLRKKLSGSGYTINSERGEGYCFEKGMKLY